MEYLCYKDGPQLPPLNITIICNTSGRYIKFYNERLDGVKYEVSASVFTELCEVKVQGKGYFIDLLKIERIFKISWYLITNDMQNKLTCYETKKNYNTLDKD